MIIIVTFNFSNVFILASFTVLYWRILSLNTVSLWKPVWWSLRFNIPMSNIASFTFSALVIWLLSALMFFYWIFVITAQWDVWDIWYLVVKIHSVNFLIIIWKCICMIIISFCIILSMLFSNFFVLHLFWFNTTSKRLTLIKIHKSWDFTYSVWMLWKLAR